MDDVILALHAVRFQFGLCFDNDKCDGVFLIILINVVVMFLLVKCSTMQSEREFGLTVEVFSGATAAPPPPPPSSPV